QPNQCESLPQRVQRHPHRACAYLRGNSRLHRRARFPGRRHRSAKLPVPVYQGSKPTALFHLRRHQRGSDGDESLEIAQQLYRLIHPLDRHYLEPRDLCLGLVGARHDRFLEAELRRLLEPVLAARGRPHLAGEPDLAEHHDLFRNRPVGERGHDCEAHREVGRGRADGLVTPRRPLSVIANTPSSLTAPKRFFTARISRKLECGSPSKYRTVSTICSSTRGPAIAPSLVTCPMMNSAVPPFLAWRASCAVPSR